MKKNKTIILSILLMTLLNGIIYLAPMSQGLKAFAETTTEEKVQKAGVLFNEIAPEASEFPQAVLDAGIDIKELQIAMEAYYKEIYTKEEKASATKIIAPEDIDALIESFSEKEPFNQLNIMVEPVEIALAGDKLQVARIVVQMPFKDAEKIQKDNDILILNEALANLGNHLMMLAYYDEKTDTLTPMHLTNSLNPIFYNEKIQ